MLADAHSVGHARQQAPHLPSAAALPIDGSSAEQPSSLALNGAPRPSAAQNVTHKRDGSGSRGRPIAGPGPGNGNTHHNLPTHRAASAQRAQPSDPLHGRTTHPLDTALQRKTSNNYGHHRQTSVIHGLQHSRNPSFNSPVNASPLSPESLHHAGLRHAANMRRAQGTPYDVPPSSFVSPLTPAESTHSQNHSIDSTIGLDTLGHEDSTVAAVKKKRTGTSRSHRGHAHGSSMGYQQAELRTPGEFALHHLFHAFVVRADQKIGQCLTNNENFPSPVEQICGRGVDPSFDQLVSALGHVARQEPKPLVDSLMLWRKAKGDAASAYKRQLHQHKAQTSGSILPGHLPRRHTEPVHADPTSPQAFPGSTTAPADDTPDEYFQADRRATVSVYMLCRVLVEIFDESSLAAITPELAMRLEDIVFTQLKDVEPVQIIHSDLRLANWRVYGELLGVMSRLDFVHVSRRYHEQLDVWQQEIAKSTGTVGARDLEMRVELLLHSMRNLKIGQDRAATYSYCEFLKGLAGLFSDSHGPTIKQAYCHTFEKLLVQLSSEAEHLHTIPRFRECSDMLTTRLTQMLSKVRHWSSALPTSSLLLCFAPPDVFFAQWQQFVTGLAQKLKDRSTRTPAMRSICQLLWTYLRRSQDLPAIRLRKVEEVVRMTFPPGRKTTIANEPSIAEAFVGFVRIVGAAFPDLCFRSLIFPLINCDLFLSNKELRIEQMEPERMVIGVRAFLAVLSDLETGRDNLPPFPVFSVATPPAPESTPMSPTPFRAALSSHVAPPPNRPADPMPSTPADITKFDDLTKQRYLQFCEVLGKMVILCDHTFGSSAAFNEKFAVSPAVYAPKTPLVDAFTLVRKEDGMGVEQKQSYYELLHVAIQALPRCVSDHIPLNHLINLLCTGSAHMQAQLASSAAQSLKAIANQGHAQAVATAFPRFIFHYDSQYSTLSDEGRLGPAHIEATLTLYVELLQIWLAQLRQKSKNSSLDTKDRTGLPSSRAVQMEMTHAVSLVDEMEAYGLFFLCSQSRRVRDYAIRVLSLVLQFDEVLDKVESGRIINILETRSAEILDLDSNALSVAERVRLQKDKRRAGLQSTLINICSSEITYDSTLWFKGFPNLIRCIYDMCPNAVALSRVIVCDRLVLMQPDIEKLSARSASSPDPRLLGRSAATPIEALLDQWKLYLIMACVTLSSPGGQSQSQLANAAHIRKTSKGASNMQEKLSSARALFSAVIPMLGSGQDAIRNAVVVALGSINRKLYRTLLESLQYAVVTCNDEAKARLGSHQRTPSSPQRSQMTERMRTEVTHIYKLTTTFLRHDDVLEEEWIVNNLINYTRDLRIFLSDAEVQGDWRFLKIRYHYCGLIEELYANVNRSPTPSRWMPFESRKSAFTLMEEWCGFAPDRAAAQRHADGHQAHMLSGQRDAGDRTNPTATIEKEKSNLKLAALGAMASLCAGPISVKTETNTRLYFNLARMLSWIDTIFATTNDKVHAIGQRALKLLLLHNTDMPMIIEHAIQQCYGAKSPRALESYFSVLTEVLIEEAKYPVPLTRVLGAVIFTLGNDNRDIRMKSARLLRILDERQQKSSNLQDFDISISDKTRAVYKLAQFEYSKRLASAHPDLGFAVFSEFSLQFKRASTDYQRSMVAAILPWLQTLELQLDSLTGGPTAVSYMLLSNMLEITVRCSATLHNEVQALWQALATGPHAGNVQLMLDFIINLSLDRREQNFVEYAKQIVVYLSATPAGSRVLEFLLMQLVPKNMINEKKANDTASPDTTGLPYVADLSTMLHVGHKSAGLSLGQVALIFLVDLMVPPVTLKIEDAIKLVHAVIILWDHYTMSVQEQAREMLVHLVHELVTTKIKDSVLRTEHQQIEDLVEAVRGNDSTVTWSYEDHTGKDELETTEYRVPLAMSHLAEKVVSIFNLAYEGFSDLWAKEALHWASICPVRHLACRSFQVFRCISVAVDTRMLADMLARLSNTIADEQADYQTFSLEILTTLKVVIRAFEPKNLLKHPQLFWTTCACLNTIHEREFFESLGMLEALLARLDLKDPGVIDALVQSKPEKWEGIFTGIQSLVYKGLKSADCFEQTLIVLHALAIVPNHELIGGPDRLLFNVLANLPCFLYQLGSDTTNTVAIDHAERLADMSTKAGHMDLGLCMHKLAISGFTSEGALLSDATASIASAFLPEFDAQCLIFMMGLLTNQTHWFRVKTMDVLCELIPMINMRHPTITSHGPDLISPLLRLLSTEHCVQALKVMDHIMEVSVTPMDKHHLRMSMASGSAKALRKEYEKTKSLYGIPMPSGWSIPMPAIHSNLTRNNVHAVFYTCGDPDVTEEQTVGTPDVEFHADDGYSESYFPGQITADTIRATDTAKEPNLGDLVSTLDSLDDFFDDIDSEPTPTHADTGGVSTFFAGSLEEDDTNVYDQHTAPILSRSLARTSSSLSFQNGLAESRPTTGHQHRPQISFSSSGYSAQTSFSSIDELSGPGPSMTETIRKVIPPSQSSAPTPSRPALHARSITSPSNQFLVSQSTSAGFVPTLPSVSPFHTSSDGQPYHEDAFSDSETASFPPLVTTTSNTAKPIGLSSNTPASSQQQTTPQSATEPGGFSFRRGMRRLTGGRSESAKEKARLRGLSGSQPPLVPNANPISSLSPRVPRVPAEFLSSPNNPNSTAQGLPPSAEKTPTFLNSNHGAGVDSL